ncbi:MAG: class I SAM-dependent methyltransferase [Cyanobacteria bacterium P01_A01_bin.17]
MQSLLTYLSSQLRSPSGLGGRLILRLLNRENATMNQLTLTQLDVKMGQHILEIGFGGGDLIDRLLRTERSLQITGIDPSLASMAVVHNRFKREITAGQLTVHQAAAEALPFSDNAFDAVATVNTLYFWSDISAVLQNCRRVLKASGKLAIAYNSKAFLEENQATQKGFRAYDEAEVETQMQQAGFTQIQTLSDNSVSNGQFLCSCGVLTD